MKKDKEEIKISELRKAEKRIFALQKEISNLPKEKLDKKIFVGPWRFLKVRADVLRSSIGAQVAQVVEKCNTYCLGKKKEPNSYRMTVEVAYPINGDMLHGSTFRQEGQGLRPLFQKEFEAAGFPEHFEKKWFDKQEISRSVGSKNLVSYRYFPKIAPHMLEFDYKPAYMIEATKAGGDLESELVRLYRLMNSSNGWSKLHGNYKDEWTLSLDKKKKLRKLSLKEAKNELSQID
jgi:hypothetical protein